MQRIQHWIGVAQVTAGAVLWGSIGLFVTELARAGLTTLDVATVRIVVAWVFLSALVLGGRMPVPRLQRRHWLFFAVYGLLSVALYNVFYFEAITRDGMAVAVALLNTAPLWAVAGARLFLGERIRLPFAAALIAGVAGTLLVIGVAAPELAAVSWAGIAFGLGSGLCWGAFGIFGKRVQARYDAFTTLFYAFLFGGAMLLALFVARGGPARLAALDADGWLLLLLLSLVPTCLAYLLYVRGLHRVSAQEAALFTLSETVVAAGLGVAWFGEQLRLAQWAGMALVLGAGALVALFRRPDGTAALDSGENNHGSDRSAQ